ncbi:hypothetical protein FPSE_11917 [Fusarium pseudograminearum CS3096]|uniref:Uncharacterized protein n=1 Tax=Fusarium pseudograminearum (strain CS3096) TaxID=1028729 RepID=K3V7V2_FUSPC|nr:hypothetical protein FPSE_11917 [Fusarium pseudograminearum CS3096]EKJ67908.1 hypothetical protein FPSE_11917 [Fusarium pseudograminearum CS3096]
MLAMLEYDPLVFRPQRSLPAIFAPPLSMLPTSRYKERRADLILSIPIYKVPPTAKRSSWGHIGLSYTQGGATGPYVDKLVAVIDHSSCLFAPERSTSRVVQSYPAQLSPKYLASSAHWVRKIAGVFLVLQSHLGDLSLPSSNLTPPLSLAPSNWRYYCYPSFQTSLVLRGRMAGCAHLVGDSCTMPPIPSNPYHSIQQLHDPYVCYIER